MWAKKQSKTELFETTPVFQALTIMAVPTIISQLIVLIYNLADTWFIGQTDDPYMVAAAALVSTVFLMITGLSNLFGVGGGNLVVQLLGRRREDEARRAASLSLVMAAGSALLFSLLCLAFMDPLLYLLGASENTIGYARQYLIPVVIIGALPTLLANTMSTMLRNVGYSKEAGFGVSLGGLLNVGLDRCSCSSSCQKDTKSSVPHWRRCCPTSSRSSISSSSTRRSGARPFWPSRAASSVYKKAPCGPSSPSACPRR